MSLDRIRSAEDPRLVRLLGTRETQNPYLHLSGQCETTDVNQSWLGFSYQADALRQRAEIRLRGLAICAPEPETRTSVSQRKTEL